VANSRRCTTKRKRGCASSRTVNLVPSLHGAHLGVGSTLTLSIDRCGWIGKYYRFTMRSLHKPRIKDSSLPIGVTGHGLRC
jgi:hypothetical protein